MRITLLLLLFPALLHPTIGGAQTFPARQISIVVPYSPGSTSDLLPRAIAPLLSQALGVAVIVENRPGAGGNLGATLVAKGDASGHTLLMAPSAILATNQWLYKDLQYDPQKDFVPVINAATTPNMMVVHPSLPAADLKALIALAKAKPGSLSFASGGNGTTSHLCGELLKTTAQIDLLHVPYKGPAPAVQDLLAGRVPLMCDNFSNVISHVRSGRLKPVALTAMKRHPQAPEVPTANESGLPGFEVNVWYGFAVHAATPKPVVQKLNAEIARALRNPTVSERLDTLGLAIVADSPEEFARFVAAESDKMRKLVQASGARVD
jgi:tripartite-type tricarboxylate transporter receptor subunit TctC